MYKLNPYKNYIFEADEQDEVIQTFGDTPTPVKSTPNEVSDVEEEIEDAEEKSNEAEEQAQAEQEGSEFSSEEDSELPDDETLSYLPFSELNKIKFIKIRSMDYGTPAGINADTGCKNCGSEDVGDVAIIDSEIEESPRDDGPKEVGGVGGGSETGGEFGTEEEGFEEEFMAYEKYRMQATGPMYFGLEGFGTTTFGGFLYEALKDAVIGIFKIVGYVAVKVAKFGGKVFVFIRNSIMDATLHVETIQKFWNFKLERQLSNINTEKLYSYTISAFPVDTWIKTAKTTISIYELLKYCDKVVFDTSKEETTNTLKGLEKLFNTIGVKINIMKNVINTDKLMDKKQHLSIEELGYTRDKMTALMRYFKEIAARTKKGSEATFERTINQCVKRIDEEARDLNKAYEEQKLDKSEEYKNKQDMIMNHMMRLDWCFCILKLCYILFDELIEQLLRVCDRYERSLDVEEAVLD